MVGCVALNSSTKVSNVRSAWSPPKICQSVIVCGSSVGPHRDGCEAASVDDGAGVVGLTVVAPTSVVLEIATEGATDVGAAELSVLSSADA